jgi:hypothetical protein
MIKKGLLFGLIAVLSAGLLFVGCDNGTTTESGGLQPATPGGLDIDRTVANEEDLKAVLGYPEVDEIAYVLDGSTTFEEGIIIPEGKIVYLLNSSGDIAVLTPATAGLEVRGALVVSENTGLNAASNRRVFLGRNGAIQIQAGGELRTDKLNSVTDLPDQGTAEASVLSRVDYAGGSTLNIGAEPGLSTTVIGTLLNAIPLGRSAAVSVKGPSRLELVAPLTAVKPSDVAAIENVSLERRVSLIPNADELTTTTNLTIPAGAEVTITQNLPQITSLSVAGALTAPRIGDGTAVVSVTVAGTAKLTVTTAIKFDPATSAISGAFNGTAVDGKIPAVDGAVINNSVFKEEDGALTTVGADVTAPLAVTAGETFQIVGNVTAKAGITVSGTLKIPKGSSLAFGEGGLIVSTSEGKIIVEGVVSGTVDGLIYSFDVDSANPTNHKYTIESVTRDLKTKTSTIVLGGTVKSGIPTEGFGKNTWGAKHDDAPDSGLWTWATIKGILNTDALSPNTVIKQFNQSFIYYKDKTESATSPATSDEKKLTPIPKQNHPNIYIPASGTGIYKIKQYESENSAKDTEANGFGVLFYSAANSKKATIEITPAETVTPPATPTKPYTVIVDWSGVTIN